MYSKIATRKLDELQFLVEEIMQVKIFRECSKCN